MLKRLSILAALGAIVAMAVAVFAPAAEAEDPPDGTFLRGQGVLTAHGDGLVAMRGRMDLVATADKGVLLVKDVAGDADVDVRGDGGTTTWHGFTVYFGVNGEAHITGSDVAVIILGEDIRLHVAGRGWAYLKGRGTYTVNGHGPFPWSPDGSFAGVGPER
jgi:hypothetical protein